jgi:hypothetical protein
MGTFHEMAGIAADPVVDLEAVRNASPLVHSILAVVLLLVTAALGVYKPFGTTPYARRVAFPARVATAGAHRVTDTEAFGRGGWEPYLALGIIGLMLLVVALHLVGGGHDGHWRTASAVRTGGAGPRERTPRAQNDFAGLPSGTLPTPAGE